MGFFQRVFNPETEKPMLYEFNQITKISQRTYLKQLSLNTVANFIARTISQSQFNVYNKNKVEFSPLYHRLNIRPNKDQSASSFWEKVIYKLIIDGEVLIIKSLDDDMLIADDFRRNEKPLDEDYFDYVHVKNHVLRGTYDMGDVIYLELDNKQLSSFMDSLFEDYGEIFGRIMDIQLRNHQIRGIINLHKTGALSQEEREALQKYIDTLHESFENSSIAIVPQTKGMEYEELTSSTNKGSDNSFDNLNKLKKSTIEDVARLLGVPPSLIFGEMADLKENMKAYLTFCINPLIKKIEDELNNKFFSYRQMRDGNKIKVIGVNKANPLENSEQADKLIASGSFNRNEVRELFGYREIEGLDEYLLTKNYEEIKENTLKGGDQDEVRDN